MTVKTDNDSVNVAVSWSPEEIQAGQDVDFSFEFKNPSSGDPFSHVNYNLKVVDTTSDKVVKAIDDLHTHSGRDTQTVKFDNVGDFTLEIKVLGLGLNQPFDTSRSGTAEAAIMVVPEFPFALAALASGVTILAIVSRAKISMRTN
jgi:hypothetical protein